MTLSESLLDPQYCWKCFFQIIYKGVLQIFFCFLYNLFLILQVDAI